MPVGGAIVRALYTHRPRVYRMCRMCRTCRVVAAPSGQRAKAMQRRARAMRERADAHGIFDPAVNRLRASSACLCELHRSASAEGLREVRSAAPQELVLNPHPHPHPDPNPHPCRPQVRAEVAAEVEVAREVAREAQQGVLAALFNTPREGVARSRRRPPLGCFRLRESP